jgi:hypothetical protein
LIVYWVGLGGKKQDLQECAAGRILRSDILREPIKICRT